MGATAIPARITIDFRDSIDPRRGWILGVAGRPSRVELLAFDTPATTTAEVAAAAASGAASPTAMRGTASQLVEVEVDCTCPEFCERDHANE
jgi:hypothetical protein